MESPNFGDEFAKMSLLSNVGRINTTMACESTASWRSYVSLTGAAPGLHKFTHLAFVLLYTS